MSDTSTITPISSRLSSLADRIGQTRKAGSAVISVPLEAISPNPQQPRKSFNEAKLARLADSIRAHGIIQPVVLKSLGVNRFELVAGERRWRAAKMADLREIPAILRDIQDGTSSLVTALIENLDREDMTPLDEATGVAELATQTSIQEAARLLGHPPQWVSKRKRIAEAPAFVLDFVAKGETSDIEALYELAKLASDDPDAAEKIIANHKKGAHLRDQIKTAANPSRGLEAPAAYPDPSGAILGDGSPVVATELESSHANIGTDDNLAVQPPPIVVQAVIRRKGEILLVTDDGKLRVSFSEKATQQLQAIWQKQ